MFTPPRPPAAVDPPPAGEGDGVRGACSVYAHTEETRRIGTKPSAKGGAVEFSYDLLVNALVSGLLLGAFYAAVTVGVSISFGILEIVNIAHPAFIILGSYIAYYFSAKLGLDPILVSIIALPAFYLLGAAIYQVYYP